ncbi:MAG: NAD(P)-binding protein [Rhodothermales bacterium]|nr:NAD(P)-binding protein [Rhodothermales bacterium]
MTNSATLPEATDVLVVGAGLSGLSCARVLVQHDVDVHVVDAADAVGGRVRTDEVDGFLLDRGFQVFLTAYSELQTQVDLKELDLRAFDPGSIVWTGASLQTLGDPFRKPGMALSSALSKVGRFGDKLKVAQLRRRLLGMTVEQCFDGPDRSTQEELEAEGFSVEFIDRFFRPFLGGVFLERKLVTTAKLFRYYFRCFAAGDAVVPSRGVQRLPEQLAVGLADRMTLNAEVASVSANAATLVDGRSIKAKQVVVAVDGGAAHQLLNTPAPDFKATVTSYFAAEQAPTEHPMLVLDGTGTGPANHVAVMSNVAPEYAPAGAHLISVSGVDAAADDPDRYRDAVPGQLRAWFGQSVDTWKHLRTYHIPHALPSHPVGGPLQTDRIPRRPDGIVVAGDYAMFGAIQGALLSGRLAAAEILEA